jgi:hypothetical protein
VIVFNNNIVLFLEKRTKNVGAFRFAPTTPQRAGAMNELIYLNLWRVAPALAPVLTLFIKKIVHF